MRFKELKNCILIWINWKNLNNVFYFLISGVTEEELLNKSIISPDDVLRLNKITESEYYIDLIQLCPMMTFRT